MLPAESRSRVRPTRGAARGPRCCRCAPRIRPSSRRQQAAGIPQSRSARARARFSRIKGRLKIETGIQSFPDRIPVSFRINQLERGSGVP